MAAEVSMEECWVEFGILWPCYMFLAGISSMEFTFQLQVLDVNGRGQLEALMAAVMVGVGL